MNKIQPELSSLAALGSVLQGPSLARGLFPLLPVQALTGGQAILH